MNDAIPVETTRLGHAGWDDHQLRGRSVFSQRPGELALADLILQVVGGPASSAESRAVVVAVGMAILNPDPRIPPMRLVRLGACYGSICGGLAAAYASFHGARVGLEAIGDTARCLQEVVATAGTSPSDTALVAALDDRRRRGLPLFGFGVPGRPRDERLPFLERHLGEVVTGPRPYADLVKQIARTQSDRLLPNVASTFAAALLDLGLDAGQVEAVTCFVGMLPLIGNAHEQAGTSTPTLRELPYAAAVRYAGPPPRRSPRS